MVTFDISDEDLITLIVALDFAIKTCDTSYQKSQFTKLKSILKKKSQSFGE